MKNTWNKLWGKEPEDDLEIVEDSATNSSTGDTTASSLDPTTVTANVGNSTAEFREELNMVLLAAKQNVPSDYLSIKSAVANNTAEIPDVDKLKPIIRTFVQMNIATVQDCVDSATNYTTILDEAAHAKTEVFNKEYEEKVTEVRNNIKFREKDISECITEIERIEGMIADMKKENHTQSITADTAESSIKYTAGNFQSTLDELKSIINKDIVNIQKAGE
jgi:hypothetical protein